MYVDINNFFSVDPKDKTKVGNRVKLIFVFF